VIGSLPIAPKLRDGSEIVLAGARISCSATRQLEVKNRAERKFEPTTGCMPGFERDA
jgi:hypothetical protein